MNNKKALTLVVATIAVVLLAGVAWVSYPSIVTLFQNQILKSNVAAVIGSGTGTATLTWNANTESDLANYRIYYGTSPRTGTDPKVCGTCGYITGITVGNVTTYAFTGLTNGQTYYFSTSAVDTSGNESAFSSEVHKAIAQITSAPVTSAPASNPSSNTTQSSSGSSAPQPTATITTQPSPTPASVIGISLPQPTNLTATANSSYQVTLSWSPSASVVGYYIYQDGYQIGNTTLTSYTATVSPGSTHTYTIASYDTKGRVSPQSSSVKVAFTAPSSPATSTPITSASTKKTSFSFTRNLSLYQTNNDVKVLQQFLNTHGFSIAAGGVGSPGNETTYFGFKTYTALIKFQKSVGLPPTGWFGPMTRAKVFAL
ncbi:MAG: peptidoglycan-binding protein [Candidatus Paceibacterota bacterium]|jgi:hypothetical protein